MLCNQRSTDKVIRIIAGDAIGVWGIWAQSCWGLVGLLPLGTAFMGFCPAYFPFKFNTSKNK